MFKKNSGFTIIFCLVCFAAYIYSVFFNNEIAAGWCAGVTLGYAILKFLEAFE